MKCEFFYDSVTGGRLRACKWIPGQKPTAVFQIVHGIAEHIDRYDTFAAFLNERGILVVAEDHMGHGKSTSDFPIGYFQGGWFSQVDDTYHLLQSTMKEYPDTPYILFGHSMGSFLARSILGKYPESGISAAIICGTGWQPEAMLHGGLAMCKLFCKANGETKPSPSLQNLVFGSYNKKVEHPVTSFDWLTRDQNMVRAYIDDPLCGFVASSGLLRDMMTGLIYIEKVSTLQAMNKSVPVLFIAGKDDPVGNYGTGVTKTYHAFLDAGLSDVSIRLFPLCRHEILNEINKEEIFAYITQWISSKLS